MFPRAIKAITDAWVALEDEEDEDGEGELIAEEEDEKTFFFYFGPMVVPTHYTVV